MLLIVFKKPYLVLSSYSDVNILNQGVRYNIPVVYWQNMREL